MGILIFPACINYVHLTSIVRKMLLFNFPHKCEFFVARFQILFKQIVNVLNFRLGPKYILWGHFLSHNNDLPLGSCQTPPWSSEVPKQPGPQRVNPIPEPLFQRIQFFTNFSFYILSMFLEIYKSIASVFFDLRISRQGVSKKNVDFQVLLIQNHQITKNGISSPKLLICI